MDFEDFLQYAVWAAFAAVLLSAAVSLPTCVYTKHKQEMAKIGCTDD